jgi:TolB-like protein/Flp pilus assembly protein TadD
MTDEPLSFMGRLKRHHIFRVASVYAIGAWVLIQLANSIFPDLGWPRQSVLILIVAVALLFPVVLILGWMFIPPSKEDPAKFSRWQRWHWRLGAALSLVVIVLVTFSGVYLWRVNSRHLMAQSAVSTPEAMTPTIIPAKSIAVLPFENLSRDPDNAYFASGIQDMILTKLADIGDLKVIARTSTERYASHPDDLRTIAQQLGVATILEGSVQKVGNRVLINVQLIDANTDSHLWAQAYTRTLNDIFGVEGDVAQMIAEALKAKLTPAESQQVAAQPTQNPQAYDSFLQGEYYRNRTPSSYLKSDIDNAIQKYREATQEDPKFALAYARLALMQLVWYRFIDDDPRVTPSAKASIDTALRLASKLAEAYLAEGFYEDYAMNDLDASLAAFEKARKLKPQGAEIIEAIGVNHKHRGQYNAAIKSYQQALAIDPRNIDTLGEMAWAYMAERRYADAQRVAIQGLSIDPESSYMVGYLSYSLLYSTSNIDRALTVLDAAPASVQNDPATIINRAYLMVLRHDYMAAGKLYDQLHSPSGISAGDLEEVKGDVKWYAGDRMKARQHYLRAAALEEAQLKTSLSKVSTAYLHLGLGYIYARLGHANEALEQGGIGIKLIPRHAEYIVVGQSLLAMAQIQAVLGHAGAAVPILDHLLSASFGGILSAPLLKIDPVWDPIRNDPRFQALLKKYEKQ